MARAISNKNVLQAKFDVADFDGAFLASFGRPELRGEWLIYGGSGCGKTTFVMQLCKYLTKFRRVAYNSLEQGLSLSLQKAWERVGMEEVGTRIILLDKESLKDLTARLRKKQSPDIIVIDSVHYWLGFKMSDYMKLRQTFPDKLFIFIAHERKGEPKGSLAQNLRYDADVKKGWKVTKPLRQHATRWRRRRRAVRTLSSGSRARLSTGQTLQTNKSYGKREQNNGRNTQGVA